MRPNNSLVCLATPSTPSNVNLCTGEKALISIQFLGERIFSGRFIGEMK